jgi:putative flavoprotein involved in K+ transport
MAPGLYFLGIPFQFGFTSMLVLGADRDAGFVADAVARRAASAGRSLAGATQSAG